MSNATLELVSWRVGRTWAKWHLSQNDKALCGIVIPEHGITCTANASSGPKMLEDLCKSCLAAYAKEPEEAA